MCHKYLSYPSLRAFILFESFCNLPFLYCFFFFFLFLPSFPFFSLSLPPSFSFFFFFLHRNSIKMIFKMTRITKWQWKGSLWQWGRKSKTFPLCVWRGGLYGMILFIETFTVIIVLCLSFEAGSFFCLLLMFSMFPYHYQANIEGGTLSKSFTSEAIVLL